MIRTKVTDSSRVFAHADEAFAHADHAFKCADQAFAEAERLMRDIPQGEHIKTNSEHTLRFAARGIGQRFKIAKKFFALGISIIWRGTGNLRFRKPNEKHL